MAAASARKRRACAMHAGAWRRGAATGGHACTQCDGTSSPSLQDDGHGMHAGAHTQCAHVCLWHSRTRAQVAAAATANQMSVMQRHAQPCVAWRVRSTYIHQRHAGGRACGQHARVGATPLGCLLSQSSLYTHTARRPTTAVWGLGARLGSSNRHMACADGRKTKAVTAGTRRLPSPCTGVRLRYHAASA